jgi:hypothetical protein
MRIAWSFSTLAGALSRHRRRPAATGAALRNAFLVLLTAALAGTDAWAGAAAPTPKVDSLKVHKLYLDGEFDAAIAILEDNLKETRQYSHGDSVFIFKHLGVMYAAHYDTREKGKYYMHRLLLVEPTARIMDMYASDMIYMIFKNIKEEYEQTRKNMAAQHRQDPQGDPSSLSDAKADASGSNGRRQARESRPSGSGRKWIWAGVAAATVATGIGVYVLMNDEPSTPSVNEVRF